MQQTCHNAQTHTQLAGSLMHLVLLQSAVPVEPLPNDSHTLNPTGVPGPVG
jgi:hypothetical protein